MERNASSRRWAFAVNRVAPSPLFTTEQRIRLLRALGIQIGEDAVVGPACYFHSNLITVGPRAWVNHGCHLEATAPIEIGADSGLSLFVTVLTSDHEVSEGPGTRLGRWSARPVRIGDRTWVGARATILPGVTIGEGCVIGAGALVKDDCEPDGVYAGVPARRVRDLEPSVTGRASAP